MFEGDRWVSVFAALLVVLTLAGGAFAAPPALTLPPGEPIRDFDGYIYQYEDASRDLTLAEVSGRADDLLTLVERGEPGFGITPDALWLALRVANPAGEPQPRVLHLQTNFMIDIAVWFETADGVREILRQTPTSPATSRPIPHPNLAATFTAPAAGEGTIWVRYTSRGSTELPIRIETPESFVAVTQNQTIKHFSVYVVLAALAVVGLVAYASLKSFTFAAYAAFVGSVLLYLVQRDGYGFQYLWPGAPGLNNFFSLPLGAGLGYFAMLFGRSYLDAPAKYPLIDKALLAAMAISLCLPPAALVFGETAMKSFATVWVFIVSVGLMAAGVVAWRREGRRLAFFTIGWSGIVVAALIVFAREHGLDVSRAAALDSIRTAIVLEAVMMGAAVMARIIDIRRERDRAQAERLEALESNLGLHHRMNDLERLYEASERASEEQGRRFADATHDIRQPLLALRLAVRDLRGNARSGSEEVARVENGLAYLETLVGEQLDQSLRGDPSRAAAAADRAPVAKIIASLDDMFSAEAVERGLTLRAVATTAETTAPPMAVFRIMSNLVANALKYAKTGGVLIGVRRFDGRRHLAVYDQGPGLSADDLAAVMRRGARGETSAGSVGAGLGLSIVTELAAEHGLALIARSAPGGGSCFAVAIDPAPAALEIAGGVDDNAASTPAPVEPARA
ncbi:MAG: sensor histidine kinase [Pseudomonadota bacterium]